MLKKSYHTTPHRLGLSVFAVALASCAAVRGQTPAELLRAMYPGVRTHNAGRNFTYFHGADMTPGQTEDQAAAAFLTVHGAAFFGTEQAAARGQPDLTLIWKMPTMDGRFVVYAYRQRIRGKEVQGSDVRIKVKRGEIPKVDFAAARLAGEPAIGSETPLVPAEVAAYLVRMQPGLDGAVIEGSPEVVVLRGDARRPDAWCWRIETRVGDGLSARRRTHFVDTSALRVLRNVDQTLQYDPPTTGTVKGYGIAGNVSVSAVQEQFHAARVATNSRCQG